MSERSSGTPGDDRPHAEQHAEFVERVLAYQPAEPKPADPEFLAILTASSDDDSSSDTDAGGEADEPLPADRAPEIRRASG